MTGGIVARRALAVESAKLGLGYRDCSDRAGLEYEYVSRCIWAAQSGRRGVLKARDLEFGKALLAATAEWKVGVTQALGDSKARTLLDYLAHAERHELWKVDPPGGENVVKWSRYEEEQLASMEGESEWRERRRAVRESLSPEARVVWEDADGRGEDSDWLRLDGDP